MFGVFACLCSFVSCIVAICMFSVLSVCIISCNLFCMPFMLICSMFMFLCLFECVVVVLLFELFICWWLCVVCV